MCRFLGSSPGRGRPGCSPWNEEEEAAWRASRCRGTEPLPSATPHPQSCPPWRCHTGCSASCAARTFCLNAGKRRSAGCAHGELTDHSSHSKQGVSALQTSLSENPQGAKKRRGKKPSRIQFFKQTELRGNFRAGDKRSAVPRREPVSPDATLCANLDRERRTRLHHW